MVDFVTQSRQYGYKYNSPETRQPTSTLRDIYRQNSEKLFKTPRVQVHDCRSDVMQNQTEPDTLDVWLFSDALSQTQQGTTELHKKPKTKKQEGEPSTPEKLLYTIGERGFLKKQFEFPRSLTTTENGEIVVADTGNHRIQRYNQCGVFIGCFGEKGAEPGQFREPSGVAVLTNGNIAVADRKNKRIQILTETGDFQYEIKTVHEPLYVRCDAYNNIIVSTTTGFIEIYRRSAALQHRFKISGLAEKGKKVIMTACPIAVNNKDEVIVSNGITGYIQYYSYKGQLLYQFVAQSLKSGLSCQPAGLAINGAGQLIVADSLNHVLYAYSERGSLLEVLLGPTDGAGALQTVALGSEGHLVVGEFSVSGTHCVKIFRYLECECHPTRPGSDRKSPSAK